MTADTLTAIFTGVQAAVVAASLVYLARQVRDGKIAAGFQAYSHVNEAYMKHLWLAADHPELNQIWEAADEARQRELDAAHVQGGRWGAWHAMGPEEKLAYRHTRAALAVFEQAWEVQRRRLIGRDTWGAWQEWLDTWKGSRYYLYVAEDNEHSVLPGFYEIIQPLPDDKRRIASLAKG